MWFQINFKYGNEMLSSLIRKMNGRVNMTFFDKWVRSMTDGCVQLPTPHRHWRHSMKVLVIWSTVPHIIVAEVCVQCALDASNSTIKRTQFTYMSSLKFHASYKIPKLRYSTDIKRLNEHTLNTNTPHVRNPILWSHKQPKS